MQDRIAKVSLRAVLAQTDAYEQILDAFVAQVRQPDPAVEVYALGELHWARVSTIALAAWASSLETASRAPEAWKIQDGQRQRRASCAYRVWKVAHVVLHWKLSRWQHFPVDASAEVHPRSFHSQGAAQDQTSKWQLGDRLL